MAQHGETLGVAEDPRPEAKDEHLGRVGSRQLRAARLELTKQRDADREKHCESQDGVRGQTLEHALRRLAADHGVGDDLDRDGRQETQGAREQSDREVQRDQAGPRARLGERASIDRSLGR